MRIRSPKSHWTSVGRTAASMRHAFETAATGNQKVDAWIKTGFDSEIRKINKRFKNLYATEEVYNEVCAKIEG